MSTVCVAFTDKSEVSTLAPRVRWSLPIPLWQRMHRMSESERDAALAPLRRYEKEKWEREHRPITLHRGPLRINEPLVPRSITQERFIHSIPIIRKACLFCKKPFEALRSDARYCSVNHRVLAFQHRKKKV